MVESWTLYVYNDIFAELPGYDLRNHQHSHLTTCTTAGDATNQEDVRSTNQAQGNVEVTNQEDVRSTNQAQGNIEVTNQDDCEIDNTTMLGDMQNGPGTSFDLVIIILVWILHIHKHMYANMIFHSYCTQRKSTLKVSPSQ